MRLRQGPRRTGPASWLLAGLVVLTGALIAAPPAAADDGPELRPARMAYLPAEEAAGTDLGAALDVPAARWRSIDPDSANLGLGQRAYWFRIAIPRGARRSDWTVAIRQTRALTLETYFVDAGGGVLARQTHGRIGPTAKTAMLSGLTRIPMPAAAARADTLYVRAQFAGTMKLPVRFMPAEEARATALTYLLIDGMVLGALAIMLAYNAVIALLLRHRVYVLYVLHVLGLFAWFAVDMTVAGYALWPDRVAWNMAAPAVFLMLSIALSLAFVREFLDLDRQMPRAARALSGTGFVLLILFAGAELAPGNTLDLAFVAVGIALALFVLAIGARLWHHGFRPARWFTIAWSTYLLGTAVSAGVMAGWLPGYYGLVICRRLGAVAEVTLLALALAARIRLADHARREAQRRAERSETARARELARERERLLRDLHDGAGHKLVTLVRWVESSRLSRAPLLAALRDILVELRMTVHGLNSQASSFGVVLGKLRQQLQPRLADSGVRLEWALAPELASTHAEPWRLLEFVRIAQEAITNALRHGDASWIRVGAGLTQRHGESMIELEIHDDGSGFDPATTGDGLGLANIRRRAARLGGEADIRSASGTGTRVRVLAPLTASDGAEHPGTARDSA